MVDIGNFLMPNGKTSKDIYKNMVVDIGNFLMANGKTLKDIHVDSPIEKQLVQTKKIKKVHLSSYY